MPCGSPGRQLWPVGLFCSPWPEQALRANIHCQISLALNRIYTEWYPSKGYTFNITHSTSYDQYYVHGRTVFEVMVRITDDIFNTYLRKRGTVNPYYSEYCDGKSVTCPGLKQWGTVTLANQGRTALPEAPVLSTVPFHVPLDRVPVEVSPSLVSSARSFTDT